ncbi:MAG: hypothetical protein WC343_07515 [Bacilli bacterium]|jgi:hypothetical protein
MLLKPTEKTFTKTVENIGTFVFQYPTLRDEIRASNGAAALLVGNSDPTVLASNIATMISALTVNIVEAPKDFNLAEIYAYEELEAVYTAFIDTVLAFRNQSAFRQPPKIEGAGA